MDLTNLAQYGSTGIAIALIIALIYIVRGSNRKDEKMLELFQNHINHNTSALTKLIEKLNQDIEVGKEVKQMLYKFNGKK